MIQFNDAEPIFIQIRQQLIEMILTGTVSEGEPLPSVRQIAVDLSVNPLTVTKAYQSLVDLEIIEKRRGLGMFVSKGGTERLLKHERDKFLTEEWPRIEVRMKTLQLDPNELMKKGPGK